MMDVDTAAIRSDDLAHYRAIDFAFSVRAEDPALAGALDALYGQFRVGPGEADGGPVYDLRRRADGYEGVLAEGWEVEAETVAGLLDYITWDVQRFAIESVTGMLAVHASAASLDGVGFAFPAHMDSGKSTLIAGLVNDGFHYLSDEAALFDPHDGALHPFAKPLKLSRSSVRAVEGLYERVMAGPFGEDRGIFHVRPDELRRGSIGGPCRLGYVIAPRYSEGATTSLEPMSRAEAAVVLAENSFNFKELGAEGLSILKAAVADADCYRLSIGDLGEAVEAVRGVAGVTS